MVPFVFEDWAILAHPGQFKMKIVNKSKNNLKLWKDIQIGEVYEGLGIDGFSKGEVCLKVSNTHLFNITKNKLIDWSGSCPDPRKMFPNAELHLNEE